MKTIFVNSSLCSACKGQCCKNYSGAYAPKDLPSVTVENIVAMFESKLACVDSWEGDVIPDGELSMVMFLRPPHKGNDRLFDASWGGECALLGPNGCTLNHDDRPQGCRNLEPMKGFPYACKDHDGGKKGAALRWRPYQSIIDQAIEIYRKTHGDYR